MRRPRQGGRERRTARVLLALGGAAVVVLAVLVVSAAARNAWSGPLPQGRSADGASAAGAGGTPAPDLSPDPSASPEPSPTASPTQPPRPRFDADRALAAVRALERCGVRREGSAAERRGAEVLMRRARSFGAEVKLRALPLPNGKTSHNVIVVVPGSSARTIVLGAHMDSKAPSPGANDNGSGCGVLVELVRCLRVSPARPTVKIVFFGAEEMIDADPAHHHYGSRYFVRHMSPLARRRLVGMISVDMVGYGGSFVVRSMGEGPRTMVNLLQRRARARGVKLRYLADPSPVGWSDHEAFERAGYPAAWLEWRDDPVYHTAADTSAHLVKSKLRTTGGLLLAFLYGLGDDELAVLEDD